MIGCNVYDNGPARREAMGVWSGDGMGRRRVSCTVIGHCFVDGSWWRLVVVVMVKGWRGGSCVWLYIYVRLPCGRN